MRILVTNDDGIHAPGLALLEKIAAHLGGDVWCIAPDSERSGASRSVSCYQPVRLVQAGHQRFSVSGTPADCVMLGVKELMQDRRPDLVLSGVNYGSNIGEEIGYSGTLSAAMEGSLFGIRSVGISQLYDRETGKAPWHVAERYTEPLLRALLATEWAANVMLSINFPSIAAGRELAGFQVTRQGYGNLTGGQYLNQRRVDGYGKPYYWTGVRTLVDSDVVGTDVWAVGKGFAAITPVRLDLTEEKTLAYLQTSLHLPSDILA
jgi:5'-nucleotidase